MGPQVEDEYLYKVVDALDDVAEETGKSVPQIALNWLLQRPTVATVVIGARNEEQLKANLGALGWQLTSAQMAKLDRGQLSGRRPILIGTSSNSASAIPFPCEAQSAARSVRSTAPPNRRHSSVRSNRRRMPLAVNA